MKRWTFGRTVLSASPIVQMMEVRRYSFCGLYSVFRPEVHSMRVLPEAIWSSESPIVGIRSLRDDELSSGSLWSVKTRRRSGDRVQFIVGDRCES